MFVSAVMGSNHVVDATGEVTQTQDKMTSLESKDVCVLEQDSGPCFGNFPRFYYDPASKNCEQFTYGGCKGNENNFEEKSECMRRCVKQK